MKYGINIIEESTDKGYLLLDEANNDYQTFNTFEEAETFNETFNEELDAGLVSDVVEL